MEKHGAYHLSLAHHLHDFFILRVIERTSFQIVYKVIGILGTCITGIPELLHITGGAVAIKAAEAVVRSHIAGVRRKFHIAVENKLSEISITIEITAHQLCIYPVEGTVNLCLFAEDSFVVVFRYRINIQEVTAS